jgi:hypothetical protein
MAAPASEASPRKVFSAKAEPALPVGRSTTSSPPDIRFGGDFDEGED